MAASKQLVFDSASMFSNKQTDVWQYQTREVVTNIYKDLTYNKAEGWWEDGKSGIIAEGWMHSSSDASEKHETQIVLQFTAPYDGNLDIIDKKGYISTDVNTDNGVTLWVWKNESELMEPMVIDSECNYKQQFPVINTNVEVGDTIRFILSFNGNNVGDATQISPIINYVTIAEQKAEINSDKNTETGKKAPTSAAAGLYNMQQMFSNEQDGVWKYKTREVVTGTLTDMKWDKKESRWTDGKGGIISKEWIHPSADQSDKHENNVCLQFVAPNTGNLTIYSLDGLVSVGEQSTNGVKMAILHQNTFLQKYKEIKPGEKQIFNPITIDVQEGDCINFLFSANNDNSSDMTYFIPVIAYNKKQASLSTQVKLPKEGTEDTGVYHYTKAYDGKQGPVWKYVRRETVQGVYEELKYDSKSKQWIDGKGGILADNWIHPSADQSAEHEWLVGQQFVAPKEGNITIYSANGLVSVGSSSTNGVKMGILQNSNYIMKYKEMKPGVKNLFEPITVNVDAGDEITFLFSANSDNSSDVTEFAPVIVYNAYEKIFKKVDVEIKEDDPKQTVYNSWESYGAYLNPWYYKYWVVATSTPKDMIWDEMNGGWHCEEMTACFIGEKECHPGTQERSTRVFKAPKSGYINISMLEDMIKLTANSVLEGDDGVYVSIYLFDGNSPTALMEKEYLFPDGGEEFVFNNIEDIHIYKDWEIWFVVDCNVNNQNDMVMFAPTITYTKITDEVADVYTNAGEETLYCENFFEASDKAARRALLLKNTFFNVIGVLSVMVIVGVSITVRKKYKKKGRVDAV